MNSSRPRVWFAAVQVPFLSSGLLPLVSTECEGAMGRSAVGGLFAVALIVLVISVDLLFFRNHFWERLAVNVGIVLVFVTLYFRFGRQ